MSQDEKKEKKATSLIIEQVEFSLPFKMGKARFKELYGKRFGERTEIHFETLSKTK